VIKVYSLVLVTYDHYRFEEFLGTFGDYDKVLEVISSKDTDNNLIINSSKPVGMCEKEGIPHYWVIPATIELKGSMYGNF
jgi:hypothetical protein